MVFELRTMVFELKTMVFELKLAIFPLSRALYPALFDPQYNNSTPILLHLTFCHSSRGSAI